MLRFQPSPKKALKSPPSKSFPASPQDFFHSCSQLWAIVLWATVCGCDVLSPNVSNPSSRSSPPAPSETEAPILRILTWEGYAPPQLVAQFERRTGNQVEITYLQGDTDILTYLQPQNPAEKPDSVQGLGENSAQDPAQNSAQDSAQDLARNSGHNPQEQPYDLVYPLVSDLFVNQVQFKVYQPIDLSRINNLEGLIPPIAQQVQRFTATSAGQYGLPAAWGTIGLIVNTNQVLDSVPSYQDLCNPAYANQITYPQTFPALIAAAYALGYDPLQYIVDHPRDVQGWREILETAYYYLLSCESMVHSHWDTYQEQMNLMYDEKAVISLGWDSAGWLLSQINPDIQFIVPQEGALGWITTIAIPRNAQNLEGAYAWINFMYEPENAAVFMEASGFQSPVAASREFLPPSQRRLIEASLPPNTLDRIHWYPPRLPEFDAIAEEYLADLKHESPR